MFFAGANSETDLADDPRYFAWYELITTDVAGASAFYRDVVGWGTQDASMSKLSYPLFTTGRAPAAGLIELPEEAIRVGARPRWIGYVAVTDVRATVERLRRLGGAVYVPPTDTNIGMISVVADPYAATFGLVDHRLRVRPQEPTESSKLGRVGWHELLAVDLDKEVEFYCELFGWQKADTDDHLMEAYLKLSAGGQAIGGVFRKSAEEPIPFWLLYFNVDDLDAAVQRVRAGGGKAFCNEEELPGGLSVAQCADPQGAAFALQGKRGQAPKVGWRTEWQGFSSRGQLIAPKPRRQSE
jgi:predicted enzyme related to lactoylglutathione lyase